MTPFQVPDEDDVILVEFEDESGLQTVSNDPNQFIEKSREAIDRSMKTVQRMARKAVKTIQSIPISERPTTVEFQFGIKMSGEAGAVVSKVGAEAAIVVTMTWQHKAGAK